MKDKNGKYWPPLGARPTRVAREPSIQHMPKETVSIASLCAKLEDARDKLHDIRKLIDALPTRYHFAGSPADKIREILNRA